MIKKFNIKIKYLTTINTESVDFKQSCNFTLKRKLSHHENFQLSEKFFLGKLRNFVNNTKWAY